MQNNLNSWLGVNIDELVAQKGYPTNSFKAPNGNDVYEYSVSSTSSKTVVSPGNQYFATKAYSYNTTRFCAIYFETNSAKIIINVSAKGNSCY